MRLFEVQASILPQIAFIVAEIMDQYGYQTVLRIDGDFLETIFKGKHSNSIGWQLVPSDNGYILKLMNVYMPNDLIGKGVLTQILKNLRSLPGLNGKCWVSVPMNVEGWKKIIERAGFEWYRPKIELPWHKND